MMMNVDPREQAAERQKTFKTFLCIVFLFFLPINGYTGTSVTDSLFLKDGSVITGQILRVSDLSVEIETTVGVITYRMDVIKRLFYEKGTVPVTPPTQKEISAKKFRFAETNRLLFTAYAGLFAPGSRSSYSDAFSLAGEMQLKFSKNYSANLFASFSNSSVRDSVSLAQGVTLIESSFRYTQYGYDVLPYVQAGIGVMFLNVPGGQTQTSLSFSLGTGMCILLPSKLGLTIQYRYITAKFPTYSFSPAGVLEKELKLNSSSGIYLGLSYFMD